MAERRKASDDYDEEPSSEWSTQARRFSVKSDDADDFGDFDTAEDTLGMDDELDDLKATDEGQFKKLLAKKKLKSVEVPVDDDGFDENDDFGQTALAKQKQQEAEVRVRKGSWAADMDDENEHDHSDQDHDDDDWGGGGMNDLLGRSEAAKEKLAAKEQKEAEAKLKRRRKRRAAPKPGEKDSKKKEKKSKPVKQKEPVEGAEEAKPAEEVKKDEKGAPVASEEPKVEALEEEKAPEVPGEESEVPAETEEKTEGEDEEGAERRESDEVVEEICQLPDELYKDYLKRIARTPDRTAEDDDDEEDDEEKDTDEETKAEIILTEAEKVKEETRKRISTIRSSFRAIAHKNNEIPQEIRIPKPKFRLDERIYEDVTKKAEDRIVHFHKTKEYDSAELIVLMGKIKKYFFDDEEVPHIVVKDLCHTTETYTIRLRKLTQQFLDLNELNHEMMEEENRIQHAQAELQQKEVETPPEPVKRIYAKDIIGEYEDKIQNYDIDTKHAIQRLEKRLEKRYKRECEWQDLLLKKIPSDFITPEDAEALKKAKAARGDFQLQSSESYLGEQLTLAERRQRVMDLKQEMKRPIQEYNAKVLEAKAEKPELLQRAKDIVEKLRSLQKSMPRLCRRGIPPVYDLTLEEEPERMMEITPEDIERQEIQQCIANGLLEYREKVNKELYGDAPSEKKRLSIDTYKFEGRPYRKSRKADNRSDLEEAVDPNMIPKLEEQEQFFAELLGIIEPFKTKIKKLFDERVRLELDIKVKSLYKIILIKELAIAGEFDAQEKAINERLRAQKAECADAKDKLEKSKKRIIKVQTDHKRIESEIASIHKEVSLVIGEKGKYADYLWKVFKKKVKVEKGSGSSRQNSDDSSSKSETTDSTSQDTSSDLYKLPRLKLDTNVCPDHLDYSIYSKVCELREKRNICEYHIEMSKKLMDQINKEHAEIEKVYKKFEGRLTDIGEEIKTLRRMRQKRINELVIMMVMRADQIQCIDPEEAALVKGTIMDKLIKTYPGKENILIFPRNGTDMLKSRPQELQKQAKDELQRYKNGKHMVGRLKEELKKAEKQVDVMKESVKKEMIVKYGCEVDLDKVAAAEINLRLLDTVLELNKLRNEHYKARDKIRDVMEDARYKLTQEVKNNSDYQTLDAMLIERERDLDYYAYKVANAPHQRTALTSASKSGLSITNETIDKELFDLSRTLQFQDSRIRNLKDAIRRCRVKSGLPPIIPTSLPPKKGVDYYPAAHDLPGMNERCFPKKTLPLSSLESREKCDDRIYNTENEVGATEDEEMRIFKEEFKDFLDSEKDEVMAYLAENEGEFLEAGGTDKAFSLPENISGAEPLTDDDEYEDIDDEEEAGETDKNLATNETGQNEETVEEEEEETNTATTAIDEEEEEENTFQRLNSIEPQAHYVEVNE